MTGDDDPKFHHGRAGPRVPLSFAGALAARPPSRLSRRTTKWLLVALAAVLLVTAYFRRAAPPLEDEPTAEDVQPADVLDDAFDHVPESPVHFHRTRIDSAFAFLEPRIAGVEHVRSGAAEQAARSPAAVGSSRAWPRPPPPATPASPAPTPPRKLGLVAVPVGESAKSRINTLVHQFGLDRFTFMLFIWDQSDWSKFPWFANVTAIRVARQAKFCHDADTDDPKVHARPATSGSAAFLATAKSALTSLPGVAASAPALAPLKPQLSSSFRLSRRSVAWLALAAAAIFLLTAVARRNARSPSSGADLLDPGLADRAGPLNLRDHPPRDEIHFYRSRIDPAFAFLDSRTAGVEPVLSETPDARATVSAAAVVPRGGQSRHRTSAVTASLMPLVPPPTPPRKMGLVAVPVGESAKARIDTLVRQFGLDRFAFMLFIWDHSDWSEFSWFAQVTAIRVARQAKFWYAKRFIPPEVALHYDYIWLLDDDMVLDFEWDPANATAAMRQYNVHFAQPALTMGTHFDQGKIEERVEKFKIGHWTNFYPVCSGLGYCRFAILDGFPMKHLDTKTFVGGIDQKIRELNASQKQFGDWCAEVLRTASAETKEGKFALDVCRRWAMRDPYRNYVTFREMVPRDMGRAGECLEDPTGEMAAVPWWHVRVV
ncbi:hypothetical protein AMAG_10079 [Allomyces macrogynus ATCC 38327]|uniref:Uncharacterized protein n=1 Tax=Allomyces macrogynus (strain ATCC 38327) TaxID=578462 RepID=A0A0L0SQS5_ALLM3|nr:hypothetical protein AMAG_10079 [Allomyces macrogynus ATCC 38327]|eukprot:KNE64729.1 hypothetical protein AMAG_10079 [Allomyces macrogynus ATCC 38327]